jgi:hypothetical protein
MSYLTVLCARCGCVGLADTSGARGHTPSCAQCGGAVQIVPSCIYTDDDVGLFVELSGTVAEGGISPVEATELKILLERALSTRHYDDFFDVLSSRMPGLTPVQLVFGGKPTAQLRALGMLRTIFEALALRRSSGMMARVAAASASIPQPAMKAR